MTISEAINTNITKEEYLLKIKDIHDQRRHIELVSQGGEECPDDLTEAGLAEMMQENFNKIKSLVLDVTDCEDMDINDRIYWGNHLNAFAGYVLTRESIYEEAEKFYLGAAQGFEMYEEIVPYPHSVPWDDVEEYASGIFAHATKVYNYYASTLAFQEKDEESSQAYLDNITRARINYKLVPESSEALAEVLFRTGEHFRFDKKKDALNYLRDAVELLEETASLEEFMEVGDTRLLRYKDTYAAQLDWCGKKKEKKKVDKQLKPYEEYITWRFEFNVLDLLEEDN